MTKRELAIAGISLILGVLLMYGVRMTILYFKVNSCLDGGGRWDYQQGQCER